MCGGDCWREAWCDGHVQTCWPPHNRARFAEMAEATQQQGQPQAVLTRSLRYEAAFLWMTGREHEGAGPAENDRWTIDREV